MTRTVAITFAVDAMLSFQIGLTRCESSREE
jgi:hypothetical protein